MQEEGTWYGAFVRDLGVCLVEQGVLEHFLAVSQASGPGASAICASWLPACRPLIEKIRGSPFMRVTPLGIAIVSYLEVCALIKAATRSSLSLQSPRGRGGEGTFINAQ